MSRNGSGTYTLPSGNPVVSGTLIEASWANTTLSDLASAMTDSLSRSGQGGMTAALRLFDGTSSVPGLAWGSETTTGWYRAGAGDMRLVITGSQVIQYLSTGVAITGTLSASGNATVGGTLGVTGASTFTGAATFNGGISGSPVINAGTANGVAYLNGSKVLTTGSALTFDGNTARNNQSSGTNSYFRTTSGTVDAYFGVATAGLPTGVVVGSFSNNDVVFYQNSSEQMRLTSTGLGIGTSSPNAKLVVAGGQQYITNVSSQAAGIEFAGNANTPTTTSLFVGQGSDSNGFVYQRANAPLIFATNATERMRLDSSGNLGLGVTPSAWSTSAQTALQVYTAGVSGNGGGNTASRFTHGAYLDGSTWRYQYSGVAPARYEITGPNSGSTHSWSIAAGGTAGNAISFTQAMTLGSDGLLQVGTTVGLVADGKLQVSATGTGSGAANTVVGFNCFEETSGNKAGIWLGAMTNSNVAVIGSRTASGAIAFQTFNSGWGERARITSGGNFGLGTTDPDYGSFGASERILGVTGVAGNRGRLSLQNTSTGTTGVAGTIAFFNGSTQLASFEVIADGATNRGFYAFNTNNGTSNAERIRIDSSGNLLVGTTSASAGGMPSGTRFCSFTSGAPTAGFRRAESSGTNEYVRFTDGDDQDCGSIDVNATANTTAYTTSSDYRLKQDVAPMTNALATVAQLNPVTWNWKHAPEVAGQGFIAHELQAVVPDAVTGEKDAVDEEGKPVYQGIDTSFLVATLTAAIQELKAEFDAYKATHP